MAAVANAMHKTIRRNLAEAARTMSAAEYPVQADRGRQKASASSSVTSPTPTYFFLCAQAKGEKSPATGNYEKTADRDGLVKALDESLSVLRRSVRGDYRCDVRRVGEAGGAGSESRSGAGRVLMFNTTHNNEHYGNLVVYMRLKGTCRRQAPAPPRRSRSAPANRARPWRQTIQERS